VTEASRAPLRLTVAAALATAAATLGLERLVQTGPWVTICFALIVIVAVVGHLARSTRLPRPVIVLVQLAAALCAVTVMRAPGSAIAFFIPGPGALHELARQVSEGRVNITEEAPPAAATPGITTIVALVCLAFAILIDALAVTYRRAVLAGLPLLAVYLIPATRKPGGLSWLAFAVSAVGYLSLVSAEGHDRLSRWGRALGGPARVPGELSGPVNNPHSALSRRITSTAVVAALVLPWFIPTLPGVFKTGGGGVGGVGGTISINQSVDLQKSLTSQTAVPLLQYTSTSSDVRNDYLQMFALDTFNGDKWTSGTAPSNPVTSTRLTVPGLTTTGVAQSTVTTQVTVVGDLSMSAIPVPYAPSGLSGINSPIYDPNTLEIVPGDSTTRDRNGQKYTVTSTDVLPTNGQMEAASQAPDTSLARYLSLPNDFPPDVRTLARQITAGDQTPYEKALSLQAYFINNFTYSLQVAAADGNSAIEEFLKTRKGFCQQFAGTMAAMARALGIPAYVAVGFTPGTEQTGRGPYVVTTHDAHAWPMLYFSGLGWLRFEPTPSIQSSGRGSSPSYTRTTVTNVRASSSADAANPSVTANPSASASQCAAQIRRISGGCEGQDSTGPISAVRPFASWGPLGVFPRWFEHWFLTGSAAQIGGKLAALVLLLLAAVPALGRLGRRRRRRQLVKQAERYLARAARSRENGEELPPTPPGRTWQRDGGPKDPMATIALAAWAELRECADDLGYAWVDSDTPRQAASRLKSAARMDEQAAEAIGRVTLLTEQARYADAKAYDQPTLRALPRDLRTLRAALAEHASRANRIRAAILPASSLSRLRDGRERVSASIYRGGRRREDD
jgi:transglutaminase-like putative cysteine protease